MVTSAEQDYLKAVFAISEAEEPVTVARIAAYMPVSQPSVSAMVKKLHGHGWIERTPGGGVALTKSGIRQAVDIIRRHRLVETFLFEMMHYPLEDIHEEAEAIEHAISDQFVVRLAEVLGDPVRDPHGDPIPRADLTYPEIVDVPLAAAPAASIAQIARIKDKDRDLVRHLVSMGLVPGVPLEVEGRDDFGGPTWVRSDNVRHALGDALVSAIYVEIIDR